jgi:beta-mannanase
MVANGVFDEAYLSFFNDVKLYDMTVYFRTMHEMNGGWYPWSGSPQDYKNAWTRIRSLAQKAGVLTGTL